MSEAFTTFGYALGLATSEEASFFTDQSVPLPKEFQVIDDLAYRELKITGKTVGIIIFPELKNAKTVPEKTLRSITRMCSDKQKETDLLIGMSPWGYWSEQSYLKSLPLAGVDILLGSGAGVEVAGVAMNNGNTWWCRAYNKGKYVIKIDVESWPSRKKAPLWKEKENIRTEPVVLTDGFVEDNDMLSIIGQALN
ncbi:MAG: hypothetical protein KKC99_07525 [Proteobacteria bacterium]|nr:hypothetical protein [Pseudomonadota bacterium]